MPPKPKCTKEEIAAAAFEIIKEKGQAALTARDLGRKLGTSPSPIFTVCENMDEVKMAARELALEDFKAYIGDYQNHTPAFKRFGMMMVSYAIHEPELFKLLFMQEHHERQSFVNAIEDLGETAEECKTLIERDYNLPADEAALLFEQMWIHTFGLGAMCAMGVCSMNEQEIGRSLGMVFAGCVMLIKSGKLAYVFSDVENEAHGTYHGNSLSDFPFIKSDDDL